jgi:hypothetical protein
MAGNRRRSSSVYEQLGDFNFGQNFRLTVAIAFGKSLGQSFPSARLAFVMMPLQGIFLAAPAFDV